MTSLNHTNDKVHSSKDEVFMFLQTSTVITSFKYSVNAQKKKYEKTFYLAIIEYSIYFGILLLHPSASDLLPDINLYISICKIFSLTFQITCSKIC